MPAGRKISDLKSRNEGRVDRAAVLVGVVLTCTLQIGMDCGHSLEQCMYELVGDVRCDIMQAH